jgi:hypothetical protein
MIKTFKPLMIMLGSVLCPLLTWTQEERSQITTDFPCPPDDNIKITKFKDAKKWQVVVNRPFDYKATPESNTDSWAWLLGDLNANGDGVVSPPFWMFQNSLNANKGSGVINNLPPNNSDFGTTHGHIEATANLNGVPKKDLSDNPDETVKVFFQKDDIHPVSGTPNWFHYWSQINTPQLQTYLTVPSIPVFDYATCSFVPQPPPSEINTMLTLSYDPTLPYNQATMQGTLGKNYFFPIISVPATGCPGFGNVMVNFDPNGNSISLGPGCGYAEHNTADPVNPIRGIHVFYKTVAHEAEHARIASEVWSTGYASNWDMDHDKYRDDWENHINANLPVGACYMFAVGTNDSVQPYNANNLGQCPMPAYSAGTEYEEWRCRDVENNVILNLINDFDWSFDPTGINQGKQW